jgi:hypothetical protein
MSKTVLALFAAASVALAAPAAEAKGCLKGAAVGGVAGHVAGGHGVVGAAAGCAIGHHHDKAKADKEAQQAAQPAQPAQPAQQGQRGTDNSGTKAGASKG